MIAVAMVGASIEIIIHQVIAILLLGWDYGFQYYLMIIPGFILLKKFKTQTIPMVLTIAGFSLLILLYFHSINHAATFHINSVKNILYIYNLMSVTTLIAVCNWLFDYTSRLHESALREANDRLYVSATTDSMTQLPNRMQTTELIKIENVRTERSGRPYSIALADIDDFKKVNDSFGHDIGDDVLISVSGIMKNSLREQDSVGRWGGEEFLVILPDTNLEDAKLALEKLRHNISSTPIIINHISVEVTVTIGTASSDEASSIDEIIKLADNALYEGKRGTKNCIVLTTASGAATIV